MAESSRSKYRTAYELAESIGLQVDWSVADKAIEELDDALFVITCSRCGHVGEAHIAPSDRGECCVGLPDGRQCNCRGFNPAIHHRNVRLPPLFNATDAIEDSVKKEPEREKITNSGRLIEP